MRGSVSVCMAKPADAVWAMVSDITRMGTWSPETVQAEWIEGATGPVVGARFKGKNKRGWLTWSTKVRVEECEPGKVFSFVTMSGKKDSTRWTYRFEPTDDGGCEVTESYQGIWEPKLGKLLFPERKRAPELERAMRETLERIKAAAEAPA